MINDHELQHLYKKGAELSHLAGLEMVWFAAQLELLGLYPGHPHEPHPHTKLLSVPDPQKHAVLKALQTK